MTRVLPIFLASIVVLASGCMTGNMQNGPSSKKGDKAETIGYYSKYASPALNMSNELGLRGLERDYYADQLERGVPRMSTGGLFDLLFHAVPAGGSPLLGLGVWASKSATRTPHFGLVSGYVEANEQNPTAKIAVKNYWDSVSSNALETLNSMGFTVVDSLPLNFNEKNFSLWSEEIAYQYGRVWQLDHPDPSYGCSKGAICVLRLAVSSYFNEKDETKPNGFHWMPTFFDSTISDPKNVWRMAPDNKPGFMRPSVYLVRMERSGESATATSTFDAKPFYQQLSERIGFNSIVYMSARSVPRGNGEWSKEPYLFKGGEQLRFQKP